MQMNNKYRIDRILNMAAAAGFYDVSSSMPKTQDQEGHRQAERKWVQRRHQLQGRVIWAKRDLTLRALAPQDTSAAHFTAYQAANLTVSLLDHKAGQDEQKGK